MKLKKIGCTLLTGIFTFAMATGAFAQSVEPKEADVKLEITQLVEVIKVGETVDLEALTQKKGSSYEVEWSVSGLNLDGTTFSVSVDSFELVEGDTTIVPLPVEGTDLYVDTYVSKATFTGNEVGTYQITASVVMQAGKSHVSWEGSDSKNIEVEAAKTVTGLIAKTTSVEEEFNKQGKVTGYNVTYDVYIQYDNGDEELLTSGAKTNLGASGNSKKVDVDYKDTTYQVTVSK
jgi:hypothetical protein